MELEIYLLGLTHALEIECVSMTRALGEGSDGFGLIPNPRTLELCDLKQVLCVSVFLICRGVLRG